MKSTFSCAAAWLIACSAFAAGAADQKTDKQAGEVDRLLADEIFSELPPGESLAPRTGDELFLRRVYLDLVGRLPTPNEITTFALDPSPDKRAAGIDRLLADPDFGVNWGRYWRDVIVYRRTADQLLQLVSDPLELFVEQLNANTGWDKVVRRFVSAKGNVNEHGETALFVAQLASPVDVAAETSRIFLGIQIQCAQCHDHPTDRWKREQFHELVAFFPRAGIKRGMTAGKPSLQIDSTDIGPLTRRPGMLNGALEHFMPDMKDPTAQGKQMTPVFFATGQKLASGATDDQRRESLADWITAKSNPWFAKAFVNRLWAELVGEGFYEPIDDLGPERRCSAPRTIEYLAGEFAAHDYDVKWLFRTILVTDAYQRESRPRRNANQLPFTANVPQRLRSDQLVDVLSGALGINLAVGGRGGGGRSQFGQLFGYDPSTRRSELASSIPQALMLMNSGQLTQPMSAMRSDLLLGRLLAETSDNEQVVTELYLRCLAREPSAAEVKVCLDHVRSTGDRRGAFEDVLWSLVNSEEIRYRN